MRPQNVCGHRTDDAWAHTWPTFDRRSKVPEHSQQAASGPDFGSWDVRGKLILEIVKTSAITTTDKQPVSSNQTRSCCLVMCVCVLNWRWLSTHMTHTRSPLTSTRKQPSHSKCTRFCGLTTCVVEMMLESNTVSTPNHDSPVTTNILHRYSCVLVCVREKHRSDTHGNPW